MEFSISWTEKVDLDRAFKKFGLAIQFARHAGTRKLPLLSVTSKTADSFKINLKKASILERNSTVFPACNSPFVDLRFQP